MDKKHGSDERKDSCPNCASCGGKAAAAAVLLIAGGLGGFFWGRRSGTPMSPAAAASAPETRNPASDAALGPAAPACASPEATAKAFLDSVSRQAWDETVKYFPRFKGESRRIYEGITVVSVGESARSGKNAAIGVPYEIAWKSGTTRKSTLVLRYAETAKCFVVEGGF
ncbi:MAG: hypothetical protein PHS14_16780 [Elusimicrobia bacterium]|nr:hypothetical protein [Elusimicrobiota bacterium]